MKVHSKTGTLLGAYGSPQCLSGGGGQIKICIRVKKTVKMRTNRSCNNFSL